MPRLLVLLAAICFGTTGTAQAFAPDGAGPVSVGAVRVVVGGVLLALVASVVARGTPAPRARGTTGTVVLGAVAVVAYQVTFFTGVRATGVAVGTLVALGSAPVLTGVLEWVMLRRRPSRRWAVATVLAVTGVAVLALSTTDGSRLDLLGIAAALGAGASYAVYTLASKRLLDAGWSPERVMGRVFGGAAVLAAPILLVADVAWLATGTGAAVALFLGVVPTALAYLLFARGLRRLPASDTATLTLAEPVTAGMLALLVLDEPSGPAFWAGTAVLVAGLLTLALPGRRRPPAGIPPRGLTAPLA